MFNGGGKTSFMSNRDDFTQKTVATLAKRVAWLCSNPKCRRATIGAGSGDEKVIITGVAAHITAAAPGGARYNSALTSDQRKDISNGIWLCSNCSILIDRDESAHPVHLLNEWKREAEEQSFSAIAGSSIDAQLTGKILVELDEADLQKIRSLSLPNEETLEEVAVQLHNAAKIDITTFKNERSWPKHVVPINMSSEYDRGVHEFNIDGVANAMEVVEEVSIVAAPGFGKTTMMVQIADAILSSKGSTVVFIPLAEWAMQPDTFFKMITQRNAFREFREQHLMLLAYHGRLQLFLDGWNELDDVAKLSASRQIKTLRREYPNIRIALSTRPQVVDLPISGPTIELKTLSEKQQLEIARALRGDAGAALLEETWQTDGVRELVSIPLYLNWLLAYATSGKMPTTKEEVLNLFVAEYEREQERALILRQKLFGCHQIILTELASKATSESTTVIKENLARTVVSQIENDLVSRGQITGRPEPQDVLDTLVNQHLLVWSGGNVGISFLHQQIQEWYASLEVEKLMLAAETGDVEASRILAFNVLNMPLWEESILFACERLSNRDQLSIKAVADAILQCISVDPILAAEMIYRSSPAVWDIIKDEIIAFAMRWHDSRKVDRAVGFMITAGRPEFMEQLWPLASHPNNQIQLKTFRAARQFRPSVLGANVQERLSTMPEEIRKNVLVELIMESGINGQNLVADIAKSESSVNVQFAVIESLLFRRAERFAIAIIKVANEGIWQLLARSNYTYEISDPEIVERWEQEHQKYIREETNALKKLQLLLNSSEDNPDLGNQIEVLIESAEIAIDDNDAYWTLAKAKEQYPEEVRRAILNRIENATKIPFGVADLLEGSVFVEDGVIIDLIVNTAHENRLADSATVVAGPNTVSLLITKLLELDEKIQKIDRPTEKAIIDEHYRISNRIFHSHIDAFIPALQRYSDTQDPRIISLLADILARHAQKNKNELLIMGEEVQESLIKTVNQWIEALLSLPASRQQFSDVVRVISAFPQLEFFDGLQRLLTEELTQWKRAKNDFVANRRKEYSPSASVCYTNLYKDAFAAIGGAQVVHLMILYLTNPDFGIEAAYVLKILWDKQEGDYETKFFKPWPDFSAAAARHRQRQQGDLSFESPFSNAIFSAINDIYQSKCGDKECRHILKLATIALSMPHGYNDSIISDLLQLSVPLSEKLGLLNSLVFAGYKISADTVIQGLKELLEEAKQKPWLLDAHNNQIEKWIQLLPYSDRPEALEEALELSKAHLKEPQNLRQLLASLAYAPNEQAELLLFKLAKVDSRFYANYEWLNAVVLRDTESSISRLMDLICSGTVGEYKNVLLPGKLAILVTRYPKVYHNLLQRYKLLPATIRPRIKNLLAEIADQEALLVLVQSYGEEGHDFDWILEKMVREIALGKKTSAYSQAFEYYSVNVSELRKKLLEIVYKVDTASDVAASCLDLIDRLRDEYGSVDTEPRHPDIKSGYVWPLAAQNVSKRATYCAPTIF